MIEIPLATEAFLNRLSFSDLVQVAMTLQRLALIQDDQIEKMQKLIDLQQETLDMILHKKK